MKVTIQDLKTNDGARQEAIARILRGERATVVVSPAMEAKARELFATLPAHLRARMTIVVEAM